MVSRRTLLRTVGGSATLGLAGCLDGSPPSLTTRVDLGDWTMAQHDTHNTSHNPSTKQPADLDRLFTLDGAGGGPQIHTASYLYTAGERMGAYRPVDREFVWRGDFPVEAVAVDTENTTIYAAVRNESEEHSRIVAHHAMSGERRWEQRVDGGPFSAPVVAGKNVLFGEPGRLTALARSDGSVRWRTPETHDVVHTPAVTTEAIYHAHGGSDNALLRRSRPRGALATLLGDPPGVTWRREHTYSLSCAPTVADDAVLIGSSIGTPPADHSANDAAVVAYETDGTERWRREIGSTTAGIAATEDTAYAATGVHTNTVTHEEDSRVSEDSVRRRRDAVLRALDIQTGEPRWERTFSDMGNADATPAVVHDGTGDGAVYVGLHDWREERSAVVALDESDGSTRWRRAVPAAPEAFAVLGQYLSVSLSDGRLVGFGFA